MKSYIPLLLVSFSIIILIYSMFSTKTIEGMNNNIDNNIPIQYNSHTHSMNNGSSIQKDSLGNITFICDNIIHDDGDIPEDNNHKHHTHNYGTFDVTPSACSYHGFG